MLEHAHIGTPPAGESGVVGLGMLITADIAGKEIKFLLGSREIALGDIAKDNAKDNQEKEEIDVYSEKSPLGAAVLGKKIGETVKYKAPNGKEIQVAILEAAYLF